MELAVSSLMVISPLWARITLLQP